MGKIEVVGTGRVPTIKGRAEEMLERWVNEFVDELEEVSDLAEEIDEGVILASWMTATFSMYSHVRKLVEKHGKVIEIPTTKGES
jgi:hypothetical protein